MNKFRAEIHWIEDGRHEDPETAFFASRGEAVAWVDAEFRHTDAYASIFDGDRPIGMGHFRNAAHAASVLQGRNEGPWTWFD